MGIENSPVLGAGAGDAALGTCKAFADTHMTNSNAHTVKVCGTGIKVTFYLRGRCEKYHTHQQVVGRCDSAMASATCDSWSPANDPKFGAYQSYLIEQCTSKLEEPSSSSRCSVLAP